MGPVFSVDVLSVACFCVLWFLDFLQYVSVHVVFWEAGMILCVCCVM